MQPESKTAQSNYRSVSAVYTRDRVLKTIFFPSMFEPRNCLSHFNTFTIRYKWQNSENVHFYSFIINCNVWINTLCWSQNWSKTWSSFKCDEWKRNYDIDQHNVIDSLERKRFHWHFNWTFMNHKCADVNERIFFIALFSIARVCIHK